jgi:hypothetical protein
VQIHKITVAPVKREPAAGIRQTGARPDATKARHVGSGNVNAHETPQIVHASGQQAEARKILQELAARAKERYVPSYQVALVYAGLGDKDKAFESLEAAFEERSTLLTYLKMDPRFDPLRGDARFQSMLRRLNFLEEPGTRAWATETHDVRFATGVIWVASCCHRPSRWIHTTSARNSPCSASPPYRPSTVSKVV